MSIYFDTITIIWAVTLLALFSGKLLYVRTKFSLNVLACIILYLFAQTGWMASHFTGYEWGKDAHNWIWFFFNTSVFYLLTQILFKDSEK